MKLIIIILALLFGYFFSSLDKYRHLNWFKHHVAWLEKHLSKYGIWDSQFGVVLALFLPSVALVGIVYLLGNVMSLLPFIFSVFVLFVCLDYEKLVEHIENYVDAYNQNSNEDMHKAAVFIDPYFEYNAPVLNELISRVFVQSNLRIFSVLFWFIVLGPLGALIYRMLIELHKERRDIHGGFADSIRDLYQLLNWPTSRLTVIAFALVGSLVHTIEVWRETEHANLTTNDVLLSECGFAAIQYPDSDDEEGIYCLEEAHSLINRSMILWLAVIAFSTISGWLA